MKEGHQFRRLRDAPLRFGLRRVDVLREEVDGFLPRLTTAFFTAAFFATACLTLRFLRAFACLARRDRLRNSLDQ